MRVKAKRERKRKKKSIVPSVIATIFSMIGIICAGCVMLYVIQTDAEIEEDNLVIEEVKQEVVITEEPQVHTGNFHIDDNMLRRIDFEELQAINEDAQRWLYIPDTNIDYYVMQEQTVGQYYYLWRDINKNRSSWGSILTPAIPMDLEDAHQLYFGHRMSNKDVGFGKLKACYETPEEAKKHKYIYVYYPDRSERWVVWTAIHGDQSNPVYEIPCELGTEKYKNLLADLESRALYQKVDAPDENTKTMVLSTCNGTYSGSSVRFYIVAVPEATYYYDTKTLEKEQYYEHENEVPGN